MRGIRESERRALRALAPCASVAAPLLDAAASGLFDAPVPLRRACEFAGIAQARSVEVQGALNACASQGLFAYVDQFNWRFVGDATEALTLALLLDGIALYQREVHRDRDQVSVVLTTPAGPSRLEEALDASLKGMQGIASTTRTFVDMAQAARRRFTIVTPYLDDFGAPIVLQLFSHSLAQRRELVIRAQGGGELPTGLKAVAPGLRERGVQVFNFRLGRPDGPGNETFHAKAVLADDACYVGSFNMSRWSLQYSLELGLLVEGAAARRVGDIVDGIIQVAERVAL
jgi:phosphatidylserine/phosphatidylglycerophosphate/cardiolipin synthase-like enzyme